MRSKLMQIFGFQKKRRLDACFRELMMLTP